MPITDVATYQRDEFNLRPVPGAIDLMELGDLFSPSFSMQDLLDRVSSMLQDPAAAMKRTGHGGINKLCMELLTAHPPMTELDKYSNEFRRTAQDWIMRATPPSSASAASATSTAAADATATAAGGGGHIV